MTATDPAIPTESRRGLTLRDRLLGIIGLRLAVAIVFLATELSSELVLGTQAPRFPPLVSGALLEHFWWGSVFLVTLPLVGVALLMAIVFVPSHVNETTDAPG